MAAAAAPSAALPILLLVISLAATCAAARQAPAEARTDEPIFFAGRSAAQASAVHAPAEARTDEHIFSAGRSAAQASAVHAPAEARTDEHIFFAAIEPVVTDGPPEAGFGPEDGATGMPWWFVLGVSAGAALLIVGIYAGVKAILRRGRRRRRAGGK